MEKHRLKVEDNLVLNCEFDEAKASVATIELLERKNKPTSIFTFNSLMMIGVIKSIQKMKLSIPQNISLVSFDEIPSYDIFRPKITHVIQPINSLAKEAISALIKRIKNPDYTKSIRIFLKPDLVIGESCRKI